MSIRIAVVEDIKELFSVRMSVKENILKNPALVTDEICRQFLVERGQGWVYEVDNTIAGFAIADLQDNSIWALFVRPEYEGRGIGTQLHKVMLDWYFRQTDKTVRLTTAPGTKAEKFYQKAGWHNKGLENKELRFEMDANDWIAGN